MGRWEWAVAAGVDVEMKWLCVFHSHSEEQ